MGERVVVDARLASLLDRRIELGDLALLRVAKRLDHVRERLEELLELVPLTETSRQLQLSGSHLVQEEAELVSRSHDLVGHDDAGEPERQRERQDAAEDSEEDLPISLRGPPRQIAGHFGREIRLHRHRDGERLGLAA